MRNLAFLILIISLSIFSYGQEPKANFDKESKTSTNEQKDLEKEKEAFENAISEKDAAKRVASLKSFIELYPESEQKDRALGLIVSGRAELADKTLRAGETKEGINLFKLAVKEAPTPVSDRLYRAIILQIPNNLFFRGERVAGIEVAKLIEEKVADNPNQLLALTNFYLGIENAPAAIRVAENVEKINPETKGLYQALGLAHRFNFNLEKSAASYAKVLEADKESIPAKISLAEMKRATGKSDEAVTLYKEILEVDAKNVSAMTGLTLSLFDTGKVDDAEFEMQKTLIQEPNNFFLLVGAAYWYAAKGDGEKAVTLSQKALTIEPRYAWGYIALARGFMKMGNPVDAEKTLLTGRKFGNFPTLQYELALARLNAGFYKDAANELKKQFTLENGVLKTKLGGRLEVEADNFGTLLTLERQASIFQSISSDDDEENGRKLKELLDFKQKIDAKEKEETEIVVSAKEFISGNDKMKTHRQLYVANELLEKQMALPTVLEIAKDAVQGVDNALQVTSPSSAVLANELYETRQIAFNKGEILNTPEVPRQTLESIIRGKIEQINASVLQKQEKNDEAQIRLKRAISIFPKDSIWMRDSNWRMGLILKDQGKPKEALDYFIKGYLPEEQSEAKKITLEIVYREVYGSLDGLEERLNAKPVEADPSSIFVKKDESSEQKVETKDETKTAENKTVTEILNANKDENTVEKDETKIDKLPENSLPKEGTAKPNVNKLPENINLDVFNPTKVQPTPKPIEEVKDETVKKVNSASTDETETKDNPKIKKSVETKNDSDTDSPTVVKKEKTNNVRPPLVIIEDNLSNTKTELKINNESTDKPLEEKKEDGETSKSNKAIVEERETSRDRIVNNESVEKTEIEPLTCEVLVTQEEFTLLSNGESHDFVIVVDKTTEDGKFVGVSSSPDDVEIVLQPKVMEGNRSAFFIVRSISSNIGEFKITIETPCGKKEIKVKVR